MSQFGRVMEGIPSVNPRREPDTFWHASAPEAIIMSGDGLGSQGHRQSALLATLRCIPTRRLSHVQSKSHWWAIPKYSTRADVTAS